jgi:diguanylate cyclase (GGDEF)-like protein
VDIYKDLLAEEFVKGEKISLQFRWVLYILLFILATNVWLVGGRISGFYGIILSGAAICYNLILTPFIRKGRRYKWIRYVSVSIDVLFLTTYNALDAYYNSPLVPVTSATLILYPVLLFLAALRIDKTLIIYGTALSVLSMNLLFFFAYPHFDQTVVSKLISADIPGEIYRTFYIILCGVLMLMIPGTVERLLKSQKKIYEESMKYFELARNDTLTGLANRIRIDEYLPIEIARAGRNKTKIALFFLDLNKFKPVNDNHGHDAGDMVLAEVGKRLRTIIREYDMAARVGGDEFILIINNADTAEICEIIRKRIIDIFKKPFTIKGHTVEIGSSIGLAVYPDDARDALALIELADKNMLKQKISR